MKPSVFSFRRQMVSAIASCLFVCQTFAQVKDYSLNANHYEISSPESFAMTKYGQYGITGSTGAMDTEIMLYLYEDEDFKIPVSLNYHFEGFRPMQTSGTAGYGWYLNTGGAITREIRGVKDEHIAAEGQTGDDCKGYYYFKDSGLEENEDIVSIGSGLFNGGSVKLDRAVPAYLYGSRDSFMILPGGELHRTPGDYTNYETTPDIFHFNIGGRQGDFIITGAQGQCSAYACDGAFGEYEIRFLPALHYQGGNQSEFVIYDGQGMAYTFGGDINYCDYTDNLAITHIAEEWPTTAWRLKEICAPSGRKVEFIYGTPQVYVVREYRLNTNYTYGPTSDSYNRSASLYYNGETSTDNFVVFRSLEKIVIDGKTIVQCEYADKTGLETTVTSSPREGEDMKAKRLERIRIFNHVGEQLDEFIFDHSYTTKNEGASRMFLDKITSKTKGEYSFLYDNAFKFPGFATRSMDHWGFWNGKTVPEGLIPVSYLNSQDQSLYNIGTTLKDAVYAYAKRGALTKINYPTGGSTEIQYEAHHIEKRWNKHLLNPYGSAEVCPSDFLAGGVRVKSLCNKSETQEISISYNYEKGVLNKMPRYVFAQTFETSGVAPGTIPYYGMLVQFGSGELCEPHDNHVNYGKITEKYKDGSKTERNYFSYEDYQDGYMSCYCGIYPQKFEDIATAGITMNRCEIVQDNISRCLGLLQPPSTDYSCIRGKLKSVSQYDAYGEIKEKQNYIYDVKSGPVVSAKYNVILGFAAIEFTPLYPQLKRTEQTVYFDDGKNKSHGTSFKYNSFGQLAEIKRSSGTEDGMYKTYFRYSSEIPKDTKLVYSQSYWPGAVLDVVSTQVRDSDEYLISTVSYSYSNTCPSEAMPNPKPIMITGYNFTAPVRVIDDSKIFSAGRNEWASSISFIYDATNYRPVRITQSGTTLNLVWDNFGKNIIRRSVNGQTSIYTWKDGVGLSRIISPAGKLRWYSYDGKGRLSAVRNSIGNTLLQYTYKIKTDSESNQHPLFGDNYIIAKTITDAGKSFENVDMFDELGYLKQSMSIDYAGSGKHLIQPYVYDIHRRADSLSFLPYPYSGTPGFRGNAIQEQRQYYFDNYADSCAVISREYESRPNGRLLSELKPGSEYRTGSSLHKATMEYGLNGAEDSIYRFSLIDTLKTDGYYPEGTLYKIKKTNEDGNTSIQYLDAWDKLICEQHPVSESEMAEVYYVYDTRDRLACMIQPEGVARLSETTDLNGEFVEKYCFMTKMDGKGRVISTSVPGGGKSEYVYDNNDNLLLKTTSGLLDMGLWEHMTYDDKKRIVKTELVSSTYSPEALRNNILYGATVVNLSTHVCNLGSNTYYDTEGSRSYGLLKSQVFYEIPDLSAAGVVQGDLSKTVSYTYDIEERVISRQESLSDGYKIDYSYTWNIFDEVLSITEKHTDADSTVTVYKAVNQRDEKSRIIKVRELLDDEELAEINYEYDELGRHVKSEPGTSLIREIYGYDLQGRLISHDLNRSDSTSIYHNALEYSLADKIKRAVVKHREVDLRDNRYTYDKAGRLVNSTYGGSYGYDLNSNIVSHNTGSQTKTRSYNGNHVVGNIYNASGQVTYDKQSNYRIGYNTAGYVSKLKEGTRSEKKVRYFADGSKYSDLSADGFGRKYRGSFVYYQPTAGNEYVESISAENGRIYFKNSAPVYLYHVKDQVESNVVLIDIADAMIWEQNLFDDYGQKKIDADCVTMSLNRYRFAGKEQSSSSVIADYIDFGPRLYSPNSGSWLSPDPKASSYPFQSPYSYCGGDPINFKDPSGEDWYSVPWYIPYFRDEKNINNLRPEPQILWTDAKSQEELDKQGIHGTYLGEAVIDFRGYNYERIGDEETWIEDGVIQRDEKGNPKMINTLTGEGAVAANVTIYGINGKDDVEQYAGLSVSSDPSTYAMMLPGEYRLKWQQMASSCYAKGSETYRIMTLDGSEDIPPVGGINKYTRAAVMIGVFLHRTNWSGHAANASKGCPVIDGRKWREVERQLGHSQNIYMKLTRE